MPLDDLFILAKISGESNGSVLGDLGGEGDIEGFGGGDIEGFGGGVEGISSQDFETGAAGFNLVGAATFSDISSSFSASLDEISGVASNSI